MKHPENLNYTRSDWWLRPEADGSIVLGITAWKGAELGEIVMAELPEAGEHVREGQEVGVLEVLKTTFDLHAPFDGSIEAVNEEVQGEPSLINADPYGQGWVLRLRPDSPDTLQSTLSHEQYSALRSIEA
jgi:glycine cleavage system H protein